MVPKNRTSPKLHFHIYWKTKERFDWETFASRREAMSRALELAGVGEVFVIQEFSAGCSVCNLKSAPATKKAAH